VEFNFLTGFGVHAAYDRVFASGDEGESWDEIASYLPGISSVEVAVLES
jgi:hypothetical protein